MADGTDRRLAALDLVLSVDEVSSSELESGSETGTAADDGAAIGPDSL